MAALVPSLVKLRSEFDALFPNRDRTTDGWIGDPAHQARDSDHNRDSRGLVHAIDVDAGLSPVGDMQAFVDFIVARCKSGAEKRLKYVIYNKRIWSASWGWTRRSYGGTNPHTEHAHFSASYTPAHEQDVANWRLEEVPVALTEADKKWLAAQIDKAATDAAARTWATRFQRPGEEAGKTTSAGAYQSYTDVVIDRAADRVITEVKAAIKAADQGA